MLWLYAAGLGMGGGPAVVVVTPAPLVADVIHFAFTQADAVNFAYTQADAVDFVRVP